MTLVNQRDGRAAIGKIVYSDFQEWAEIFVYRRTATAFLAVLFLATVSCRTALADGAGGALMSRMDVHAPKYNTPACQSARIQASNDNSSDSGHLAILAGVTFAVGLIFAFPMAIGMDKAESARETALLHQLMDACGEESFFQFFYDEAVHGNADAQAWLGHAYNKGIGTTADSAQAVYWYRRAVDQGNPPAMVNLGTMYYRGSDVPQDYAQAYALWSRAADDDFAPALSDLGEMYFSGRGVNQDQAKAISLWRRAAKMHYGTADANLGKAYLAGTGVPQDDNEALKYLLAGVWDGSSVADIELAKLYENGKVVAQSDIDSYKWYSVAEKNGAPEIAPKRAEMAAKLTPKQIEDEDAVVKQCLDSHFMNCP